MLCISNLSYFYFCMIISCVWLIVLEPVRPRLLASFSVLYTTIVRTRYHLKVEIVCLVLSNATARVFCFKTKLCTDSLQRLEIYCLDGTQFHRTLLNLNAWNSAGASMYVLYIYLRPFDWYDFTIFDLVLSKMFFVFFCMFSNFYSKNKKKCKLNNS